MRSVPGADAPGTFDASQRITMIIHDLLTPDAVIAPLKANGKKQALQEIAERAAAVTGLPEREIFETLLQRERLGSTGIGEGIAIPHGRSASLDRLRGLFVRMEKPIDFEALDGQPVDILFVLLAPEGAGADHLKALARVARVLRDRSTLDHIRRADDADAIYAILTTRAAQAA
jgi:PTS system nitrogen regulatory IIA component